MEAVRRKRGGCLRKKEVSSKSLDGGLEATERLFFAEHVGYFPDMRSASSTHEGDTESVHHQAHALLFLRNPLHQNLVERLRIPFVDAFEDGVQLAHVCRRLLFPAFLERFLVVCSRSNEEESGLIP